MAPQSDIERLQSAWRALAGIDSAEGWRTIPISVEGPCRLLAGRHFPGNEEAILISFPSVRYTRRQRSAAGAGFQGSQGPWGNAWRSATHGSPYPASRRGAVTSLR